MNFSKYLPAIHTFLIISVLLLTLPQQAKAAIPQEKPEVTTAQHESPAETNVTIDEDSEIANIDAEEPVKNESEEKEQIEATPITTAQSETDQEAVQPEKVVAPESPTEEPVEAETTIDAEETVPEPNTQLFKIISENKKITLPLLGTVTFAIDALTDITQLAPTAEIVGKPEKTDIDLKVIQFTNPIFMFSLNTGLTLKATLTCFGQELGQALLTIVFDKHGKFVSFSGTLAAEKTLKPFEKIPGATNIPGLKDIEIKQLKIGLDSTLNIQFSGQSTILGINSEAYLQVVEGDGKKTMPLLKAKPLEPLILTKILPVLSKTPLDGLSFSEALFIIAAQKYFDTESSLTFGTGVSLTGTMKLAGSLFENARKLIPILPKEAFTQCTIGDEPQFMLRVADSFNLGGDTSLESIFLSIQSHKLSPTGPRIDMSLKTKIKTKLPKEKEFTLFTGEVSIPLDPKLPTIVMKGTMQGIWNNVLGLRGISISDVAFELGALIATGFTPTSIGFAGTLDIGDKKVKMATKTSKDGEFVLYGKLDGEIGFTDILSLANATGVKVPKEKIPDFSLKNVEVKIAPQAAKIGELFFAKGTTLIGELTIKGCDFLKLDSAKTKAILDVTIDDLSVNGKGSITTISLANILKITGAGLDGKKGTDDDGPTVKLVLTPLEQSFVLSGEINILGAQCAAEVDLSPTNAYFNTTLNLAPGLAAKAKGEMIKTSAIPDFKITGEISAPTTLPFGKKDLEAGTQILEENRDQVKKEFQDKISNLEQKIKTRQQQMEANPVYKKLLSELNGTKSKISSVEQNVNKLESKVSGLDSETRTLERRLGFAFNIDVPANISIDSPLLNHPWKLASNKPDLNKYLAEKFDPTKFDLRIYDPQYPLFCLGWIKQRVSQAAQVVAKPALNVIAVVAAKTGITTLVDKVGGKDALDKLKNAGYNIAKIATDPSKWDDAIKLAALKTAREAARVACEAAKAPLKGLKLSLTGLEESVKNFDPEILKLRTEQVTLTAALGTKMATLEAAIITFKTTTLAAFPLINWLTPIEIKKLSISANLRGLASGELPTISCEIKAFHAIEKTITFSADLKNIPSMLKKLVLKLFLLK